MSENFELPAISEAEVLYELPSALDNETVIFSYGSLLEHEKLRELLRNRAEFKILETNNLAEAANLVKDNPRDIIILRNVRLENVRASIVTETMLRRWYKLRGGNIEKLIKAGVTTRKIPQAVYLYARPAKLHERGRTLNGGLIFNFTDVEVSMLDEYEFKPVLERVRTPEIYIENRRFVPKRITFYAGTESAEDITEEEKAERAKLLYLNRKPGCLSPHARWKSDVRRK